jgi:EXPERA (EXPanded EBP superfamily)
MNGSSTTTQQQQDVGGCEWIPWENAAVQAMPDPTRIFSFLCLTVVCVRFLITTEWDLAATVWGLFLNPYVVFFFLTACVAVRMGLQAAQKKGIVAPLPVYDRWTAEWYWWNAFLYHAVLDGATGSLRLVPVTVLQYDVLDRRFPNEHVVPWMIGMIELLVMYPLCLVTVYAVLSRSNLRFPLELIISSIHIMGMVIFIVTEVYEGQVNVPALDPVGHADGSIHLKLNLYHFVHYWFGFWFCNSIWGVVPYYRIHRAVMECQRAFATAEAAAKKQA